MGWVWRGSAFFILVGGDGTHRPHPGLRPYSPRVTPAHPERLHSTGSRADHARHDTHARTLDTLYPSALYTRHTTPGRSGRRAGRWMAWSASETVQIWTQRSGSKIYLIYEYICCVCNANPLYSVSKV
nr:MAG TPA: hypothetical protein [Caudoviricetes sp.]DAS91143.1 MAG TPA: hypothetical protein [Caudoviricetes sp.]DAU02672.1 MAG TPA: hypothetical protein [Caudoviricetes sp.]